MKSTLQVTSWIAVLFGVFAIIGGLTELKTDLTSASYAILGGVMFGPQGGLALMYVNSKRK